MPKQPKIIVTSDTLWIDVDAVTACPIDDEISKRMLAVVAKEIKGKKPQANPLAVLLYALPGSGKTTVKSSGLLNRAIAGFSHCVHLDADHLEPLITPKGLKVSSGNVKNTRLVNLQGMRIKAMSAFATCLQPGSGDLWDKAFDRVEKERLSIASQIHLNVADQLIKYRNLGYRTVLISIDTRPAEAAKRAMLRAKSSGLFFSDDFYKEYPDAYKDRKTRFAGYAHLADAWMIIDNNGKVPKVKDFSSRVKNLIRSV